MQRTVLVDARESGTSTGRYVDKLCEYMHQLKSVYHITVLTKPHRIAYFNTTCPNFEIIESPYKEFTFAEQLGLLHQINGLKPDLVHFTIVQQPVLYRGKTVTTMQDLTTVRFRNPTKNPLIFTLKQQVYKWVNKRVARKSNAVICISNYVKDDVLSFTKADPNKFTVTYESADKLPENPQPIANLEGKQFIMYIGRPTPHKNLSRLIDAFILLKEHHPDLCLVLAGKKDANYRIHEQRVIGERIEHVVFTDFIEDSQLRWLYENCAAYVFPSLSEGFGLPGLEAMVHGAPVVSSNATCLPEVYGDAAVYFDPLDVNDMAAKIDEAISNEKTRDKLIELGFKQAQKYSWKKTAEQTLAVYKSVLGD